MSYIIKSKLVTFEQNSTFWMGSLNAEFDSGSNEMCGFGQFLNNTNGMIWSRDNPKSHTNDKK